MSIPRLAFVTALVGSGAVAAFAEGPQTMPATKPAHTNRLAGETSPYLLQHAHNPVDWYPWGPEAFAAAREQGKPIFLSIGYSTCYWCHVMERESFEDETTAEIMNEHFISIKVDREERPDVDEIYMTATQIFTNGSGGWPMSIFLEPGKLQPIVAGTYFPPEPMGNRPSFKDVLTVVSDAWRSRREAVDNQAASLAEAVTQTLSRRPDPVALGPDVVTRAVEQLIDRHDSTHGGWPSGGNKFPMPSYLDLLIEVAWDRPGVEAVVRMTLDRMATGGMYDQVGGGFHRYSTDNEWTVPHFEKMLYDNGQLASTYARAYERTNDAYYAEIIRETLDYVLREMTSEAGGFLSAQDAEVNAREGQNYIWTASEVTIALREAGFENAEIAFAQEVYGFQAGTNFQDPHHPEDGRRNVVRLLHRPEGLAERNGVDLATFNSRVERINAALLSVRDTRDQPRTDDKVLTAWNGLMIGGFADGGRVLGEQRYIDAARRAASFVLSEMSGTDGGLRRSYRDGTSKIDGFFEDYALFMRGLLALYRATEEKRWLDEAIRLSDIAEENFSDPRGGFFDTLADQSDLFVRTRSIYDGALPSGNTVMIGVLVQLYELTGDDRWLDAAIEDLEGQSGVIAANPTNTTWAAIALARVIQLAPDRLAPAAVVAAPDALPGLGRLAGVQDGPVSVTVKPASVRLPQPGTQVRFTVIIEIEEGYHINARLPGPDFLVPLDFRLVNGAGYNLLAIYPAGERYLGPIADEPMQVHTGRVEIPLTLTRIGPADRQPKLSIRYQACTDQACLAPTDRVLKFTIEY